MSWKVNYSKRAEKFLTKQPQSKQIIQGELKKLVQSYHDIVVSMNITSLKGNWQGYHRIRKGDIRIIIAIDEPNKSILVHDINFRGSIY